MSNYNEISTDSPRLASSIAKVINYSIIEQITIENHLAATSMIKLQDLSPVVTLADDEAIKTLVAAAKINPFDILAMRRCQ